MKYEAMKRIKGWYWVKFKTMHLLNIVAYFLLSPIFLVVMLFTYGKELGIVELLRAWLSMCFVLPIKGEVCGRASKAKLTRPI